MNGSQNVVALRAQVVSLSAETLALSAILFELMVGLRSSGALDRLFLESAFDNAANGCLALNMLQGGKAAPGHIAAAQRAVQQLRDRFIAARHRSEPIHGAAGD